MSKIKEKVISDISALARIEISDDEIKKISNSFGPIMEMIDQVNQVDLGDKIQRNFKLKNIMREDEIKDWSSENRIEVLEVFPEKKDNYLKTKKIL